MDPGRRGTPDADTFADSARRHQPSTSRRRTHHDESLACPPRVRYSIRPASRACCQALGPARVATSDDVVQEHSRRKKPPRIRIGSGLPILPLSAVSSQAFGRHLPLIGWRLRRGAVRRGAGCAYVSDGRPAPCASMCQHLPASSPSRCAVFH